MTEERSRQIDEAPSFSSGAAGRINYFGEPVEKRPRQVPAWKRSASRREYELRLMEARLRMEELV